jgi:hypothetical protein
LSEEGSPRGVEHEDEDGGDDEESVNEQRVGEALELVVLPTPG